MKLSTENAGSGRDPKVALGKYHMVVNSCVECKAKNSGNSGFELTVEIQDGTEPDQEHKTMQYQKLYGESLFNFIAAIGMKNHATGEYFTTDVLKKIRDPENKVPPFDVDFNPEDAVGAQVFGTVVAKRDIETKKILPDAFPVLGKQFWSVADPAVADVPRNQPLIDTLFADSSAGGSARD